MKFGKETKLLYAFFLLILQYSCSINTNVGYYFESFGVAQLSPENDQMCIYNDENQLLIPKEDISSTVSAGERAWISYTVEAENEEKNVLTVTSSRVTAITTLKLQSVADIDDNGIDIWNIWLAQNFLTLDFKIHVNDWNEVKNHRFALIEQGEKNDTLSIKFIHDAANSEGSAEFRTAVALNMNDIYDRQNISTLAIEYKDIKNGAIRKYCQKVYRTAYNKKVWGN
ncbi:MAG: hypothetical protein LBG92_10070 [Prevotellaceae bacterium]|jgi:hypothetical protein|nr:hypothetical protein [Prevotellaceae bacterium]